MDYILYHHGIKGQKWGVRRFQNADGSYTQKGLKRYNIADERYQSAVKKQKEISKQVKEGTANRSDASKASRDVRRLKKQRNIAYKDLKRDYIADKGKDLAAEGKSIYENKLDARIANRKHFTVDLVANAASSYATQKFGRTKVTDLITATYNIASATTWVARNAKYSRENKQLRAYRNHTRNYNPNSNKAK